MNIQKSVLILGANSDVAKQCILQYLAKGFSVIASRNLKSLEYFVDDNGLDKNKISLQYFDATDFLLTKIFTII
jgi:NAD(P)-dependent dehydrogenase (short-subunit alcohol dehydrogenase family)